MATNKTRISVYLDEDLKQDLEKVAKLNKRSLSNLIEVTCQDIVDSAKRDRKI